MYSGVVLTATTAEAAASLCSVVYFAYCCISGVAKPGPGRA